MDLGCDRLVDDGPLRYRMADGTVRSGSRLDERYRLDGPPLLVEIPRREDFTNPLAHEMVLGEIACVEGPLRYYETD